MLYTLYEYLAVFIFQFPFDDFSNFKKNGKERTIYVYSILVGIAQEK